MSGAPRVRFCKSGPDEVRIAYTVIGRGPPLVKAGNWLSQLEVMWASPLWRHWIDALAQHYTLVLYDPRGCGLSDRAPPALSFDAWLRDLEAVVEAAGLERFALLGFSGGALFAMAYAARHPARVSHLVLHAAFARGANRRDASREDLALSNGLATLVEFGWGSSFSTFHRLFALQFMPDATVEQQRLFEALIRASTSPEQAVRRLQIVHDADVTVLAARLACPTLVLHAVGDARVPFEEGRRLAGLIPGARFVALRSRNHILAENEPAWRQWLDAVTSFLPREDEGPSVAGLTRRERELLTFVVRGWANREIAAALRLSIKTVKNHLSHAFSKLGVRNRAQAIVLLHEARAGREPPPAARPAA